MPDWVDQALLKAREHAERGEFDLAAQLYDGVIEKFPGDKRAVEGLRSLDEQRPHHRSAATNPPGQTLDDLAALYSRGQFQDVLTRGEALAEEFPMALGLHTLLGAANIALGQLEQALAIYTKALRISHDDHNSHYNVGIVLDKLGRQDEAVESYTKALRIKPDDTETLTNLGNDLYVLGRPDEAIACYARILQIEPDNADTHFNLGNSLRAAGRHDEAIESYVKALRIRPGFAEAYHNLGNLFHELGRYEDAVTAYKRVVQLAPDRMDCWQNFSVVLSGFSFDAYSEEWAEILLALLLKNTVVRPENFCEPIISFLKLNPETREYFHIDAGHLSPENLADTCSYFQAVPLFLKIIELCPIPDLETENLLKGLRKNLLMNSDFIANRDEILDFQISLALHCFTNEYVYGETDEESSAVRILEQEIENALTRNESPDLTKIACLASYRPLHQFQWARELTSQDRLRTLLKRQVDEALEENAIRNRIPSLKTIESEVSAAVREQYEDYPYPRWVNTRLHANPSSISSVAEYLELRLTGDPDAYAAAPTILIAGCGTGQHSLEAASRFLNSKVVAVDLSLTSLSYAIRKTAELGIGNIEYLQGDILDLGLLNRTFDVIESVGVLHHLADPMAGWKVLTDCLVPGGLMKIGLYSELARQHITLARQKISEMRISDTPRDMLEFRQYVLKSDDPVLRKITRAGDFYSMSALRDLLFHVQEHCFTIPQIQACLAILGLTFAGFEFSNKKTIADFRKMHPEPEAAYDLKLWHEFEMANPDIFNAMYQLWVQKGF